MTPTVPNLARSVYEQLLAVRVETTDRAVRVLALHADRTRLTRQQLVAVLTQFQPAWWDERTIAAAERLVADRGDPPPAPAAILAAELARCSCGRQPVQWLDGPRGPRTVPYCGRPLESHHGLEREAAAFETRPPAGLSDAERVQVQRLADWLVMDDADDAPPVNRTAVSSALRRMLGSGRPFEFPGGAR